MEATRYQGTREPPARSALPLSHTEASVWTANMSSQRLPAPEAVPGGRNQRSNRFSPPVTTLPLSGTRSTPCRRSPRNEAFAHTGIKGAVRVSRLALTSSPREQALPQPLARRGHFPGTRLTASPLSRPRPARLTCRWVSPCTWSRPVTVSFLSPSAPASKGWKGKPSPQQREGGETGEAKRAAPPGSSRSPSPLPPSARAQRCPPPPPPQHTQRARARGRGGAHGGGSPRRQLLGDLRLRQEWGRS